MNYSCFDQKLGLYRYFESNETLAINADLPTPPLPNPTGRVGVPSVLAGRPLPSGARFLGTGWHARGIIARCAESGLGSSFDEALQRGATNMFLVGAFVYGTVGVAAYLAYRHFR